MGGHFFTAPIPAATARRLGTGLLREAMAPLARMKLTSYDRQDGPGEPTLHPAAIVAG